MNYNISQYDKSETVRSELDEANNQEPASHYYRGGYYVLRLGEKLNKKYLIYRKIGWDEFSTKWLARDDEHNRYVTVTIYKASEMHTEYATDLIRTFNKIQEHPCKRIMLLLDHFQVTGINGIHVCIVTEVMAECLNNYMIRNKLKPTPLNMSKIIVKHVLEGLHHLHTNNKMVHTNINPETIFFKANKSYIMNLLYNTYVAFSWPVLPASFVCNLPSRLNHLRIKMADIAPKMLLRDIEFGAFEERMRNPKAIGAPVLDVDEWIGESSTEYHIPPKEDSESKVVQVQEINSLLDKISRYLKCKVS